MTVDREALSRLLAALADLDRAASENLARSLEIQERVRALRDGLEAGEPLVDLVEGEDSPRVVELISTNMAILETFGAEFRAAEALALRAEGLTIDRIASLFGVSRQRISALLKQKAAIEPGV